MARMQTETRRDVVGSNTLNGSVVEPAAHRRFGHPEHLRHLRDITGVMFGLLVGRTPASAHDREHRFDAVGVPQQLCGGAWPAT